MISRKAFVATAAAHAMLASLATAQQAVPAGGQPQIDSVSGATLVVNRHPARIAAAQRRAPDVSAEVFDLPPVVIDPDRSAGYPFYVGGFVDPPPAPVAPSGAWQPAPGGGWGFVVELVSPDAYGLRVRLGAPFSHNIELRVYDPLGGASFGPFRPAPDENGDWWTTLIFGPTIGLEFFVEEPGDAFPPIPAITAIGAMHDPPPDPRGDCSHRAVSCEPSYAAEATGVCMLSFIDGGGNVIGFCTGAQLWRQPADGCPLVMTANHCLGNQGAANTTVFVWNYQTANCSDPAPSQTFLNNLPRNNGSLMLKRYTASDWNLVGMYEPPQVGSFLGWWTGYWDDGSTAISIHHPGGTHKRIAFGEKVDDYEQEFCDDNDNCFDSEIWEIDHGQGFTEPGSSGSPVLDGNRLVRGTLCGGPDSPCDISKYGRLDLAYDHLRYYMGNAAIASPVHANLGVPGDPGNNGFLEQGTAGLPFNTVYEATFAVRPGDTVQIAPGGYNERFTIWRPMRLARQGSSGTVVIGQ